LLRSKILVIAPSWIGDAVLAQPMLARLCQKFPNVKIDMFAPAWVAPLFAFMPQVANVIDNPFAHGELGFAARRNLGRVLKANRYDQVIVLPNSLKSALVPFFAAIPLRTGYRGEFRLGLLNDIRRLDETKTPLMVERFAALAEEGRIGLTHPVPNPKLVVDAGKFIEARKRFGIDENKQLAIFCPGAEYGPAKRWPMEYFSALGDRLLERGFSLCLLGSSKDAAVGDAIVEKSRSEVINLCGKTNLSDAVYLLASADLVVTNDSGLMHIAAALDRPQISLFGSSSPGFTPPLSPQAKVLSLNLDCSPCFKRECPLGHFNCMKQLTPELVLEKINSL
jgi:heptosyltransferase II